MNSQTPQHEKEWNKPVDGVIYVPDELDPIINKVATQIRFHTISGKSEQETVCDIVAICQKFFTTQREQDIRDAWEAGKLYGKDMESAIYYQRDNLAPDLETYINKQK